MQIFEEQLMLIFIEIQGSCVFIYMYAAGKFINPSVKKYNIEANLTHIMHVWIEYFKVLAKEHAT